MKEIYAKLCIYTFRLSYPNFGERVTKSHCHIFTADDIYAAQQAQHQLEEQELTRAWWKQKFPKELTREKESVFYLSAHCKSRTRLYHTLLHYKFRLLLNIREKIQDIANRMCGEQLPGSPGFPGILTLFVFLCVVWCYYEAQFTHCDGNCCGHTPHSSLWSFTSGSSTSSSGQKRTISISSKYQRFDTSWEDWEPQERRYLLEAAVEELKQVCIVARHLLDVLRIFWN